MSKLVRMTHGEAEPTCEGISSEACERAPLNFLRLLVAQLLTKIADALSSAKIVLPWLMASIGVPTVLIGMLVPIRESGSLIPQVAIGGVVQRYAVRKYFFVFGCIAQAAAVAGMGIAAIYLQGEVAGFTILTLLLALSLARGFCSVASKDVLGKTIPKQRRGRLGGISASLAGLVAVATGVALIFDLLVKGQSLFWLLFAASLCWFFAACLFAFVAEFKGETAGDNGTIESAISSISLLKTDPTFRRFVTARCLLLSSALSAPYLVILSQQAGDWHIMTGPGLFIVVSGLASLISGKLWGEMADASSRKVMVATAIMTAVLTGAASAIVLFAEDSLPLLCVLLFFLLALVHQGVRLGRKTYVVDIADGNRRTDYVTVSNTIIGVMLLLVGLIGALIAQASIAVVLAFFAATSLIAAIVATTLPEA